MMIKILGWCLIGLIIFLMISVVRILVKMQEDIDFLEEAVEKAVSHMVKMNENLILLHSKINPNEFKDALNKLTPEQLKEFEELFSTEKNKHH